MERQAKQSGTPINVCPTCGSRELEGPSGFPERTHGVYRFRGEELECNCERQILLRKHYTLAGIPDQYMRLNWLDYDGNPDALAAVKAILDNWESWNRNGMGLEFGGPSLGTGKTFAATHIGKELVKRNVDVFFCRFELAARAAANGDKETVTRLREAPVLIFDEVTTALSEKQLAWFAYEFEHIVRERTDWNRNTIITTNLTEEQVRQGYPRPYSILAAKQFRVDMTGEDARQGKVGTENVELTLNNEIRPIT